MKGYNAFTSKSSWRDRDSFLLRDSQLTAFFEILFVISIYLLKVNGWLPMSKIPILVFGFISLWLRGIGWREVGMVKPVNWKLTIILGVGIAILDNLFGLVVTLPLLHRITGEATNLTQFNAIRGNVVDLIFWLILSWTYAAIAEEMIYRGYLLNRLADLFGRNKLGWVLSIFFSSVMFGLVHESMGITGVLNASLSGLLYGIAYLVFGRNLWIPIIIHGVGNTIGLVMIFFGVYPW